MNSMSTPVRSRSAQVSLYGDVLYVFSDMLVHRLGMTPLRLESKFPRPEVDAVRLGRAVREAIDRSLPWVEWEEFERTYDKLGDPISQAFGIPNDDLNKAQKKSGRVTVEDWPDLTHYLCTKWTRTGASGKPMENTYPPLEKDCSDQELGEQVLNCLRDSLEATLAANKKRR
jgi:hypothetical protein